MAKIEGKKRSKIVLEMSQNEKDLGSFNAKENDEAYIDWYIKSMNKLYSF